MPEIIEKMNQELETLLTKDKEPYVKLEEVAKFLGADAQCLRNTIYRGTCPFGFGYPGDSLHNGYAKIPKLVFYNWVMAGGRLKQNW